MTGGRRHTISPRIGFDVDDTASCMESSSMRAHSRQAACSPSSPTCRGVWLDRGELEKLMAAGAQNSVPPPGSPYAPPPQQPWSTGRGERGERGEYGERGERGEYGEGYGGYRKKRGSI